MRRVDVLLATYNGERFLREQVESVLGQECEAEVRVLARDDGSSDGTVGLLEEFKRRFPGRFLVVRDGERSGGVKWNFVRLMRASAAEYVCFCDQDDVWLPGKLQRELETMRGLETRRGDGVPLLVFSDLKVVNERLEVLHGSFWRQEKIRGEDVHRLARLLRQNVVTGCTAMVNRAMVERAVRMPEEAPMHDAWVGLLACALGESAALGEPTVLYRQHGANVVGAKVGRDSVGELVGRAADPAGRKAEWERQQKVAAALLRLHGAEMAPEKRAVLEEFLQCGQSRSRLGRVVRLVRGGFWRRSWLANVATVWELLRG